MARNESEVQRNRMVIYRLSDKDTTNLERVGAEVSAFIESPSEDGATLVVYLTPLDVPAAINFDPKLRRAPINLCSVAWIPDVKRGSGVGEFRFYNDPVTVKP